MTHAKTDTVWPPDVLTLSIDIGGSGFKASIVSAQGVMTTERVRVDTPYPCPPDRLVATVNELVAPLLAVHRVSVGFPGLVRHGHVIEVPSLSRSTYGGERDRDLADAWHGFDLAHALAQSFQLPTKVVNDADMQGCAVVSGQGLEFVMTLGTGVGTALFNDGTLLPHLELSHGPFRDGMTFDIALGNAQRKEIGNERWTKRVRRAIQAFDDMLFFDRIYVGGGNAKHLTPADTGTKGEIVPNTSGILGGVRVWDLDA
jgi:polyphosphate glucokinase